MSTEQGFTVELDLLNKPITTLAELGDLTRDLVTTASRLAERLPMLGTAPPAVHLATRLRDAAGGSGLAGAVESAEREVREFQEMLAAAKSRYQEHEDQSGQDLQTVQAKAEGAGERTETSVPATGTGAPQPSADSPADTGSNTPGRSA